MALPIEPSCVDRDAIDRIVGELGLTLSYAEQYEYISSLATRDIQAAPGCGKTTLTAVKLCLLAGGWQSEKSGVCVISHTNVAKDEIIKIVNGHPQGRRLLTYPHFIGTIQSFVHTFFALPCLRARGIDLHAIDDETYARVAISRMQIRRKYPALLGASARRGDIAPAVAASSFSYSEGNLVVGQGRFPYGLHTDSGKEFVQLKHDLLKDGYLRYADMYALGLDYALRNGVLLEALRSRFPLLLIDEAQDMDSTQEDFLSLVFHSEETVVQRIGDINQQIYSKNTHANAFPSDQVLVLPQTMRFGDKIASAASRLTHTHPQTISGNPDKAEDPPIAIILFDPDSIGHVLKAFERIVTEHVAKEELDKYGVALVGARKSSGAASFPAVISQYVPEELRGAASVRPATFAAVCEGVRDAVAATGSFSSSADSLWGGVSDICAHSGIRIDGRVPSRHKLKSTLIDTDGHLFKFKKLLYEIVFQPDLDEGTWNGKIREMLALLSDTFRETEEVAEYLEFEGVTRQFNLDERNADVTGGETFSLPIKISTIHGVKGETHAATLVVECSTNQIFDLKEILPIFVGKEDKRRVNGPTIQDSIRHIFVAMTRPRSLVAFAVMKNHIEHLIPDFEAHGYILVDVTMFMHPDGTPF